MPVLFRASHMCQIPRINGGCRGETVGIRKAVFITKACYRSPEQCDPYVDALPTKWESRHMEPCCGIGGDVYRVVSSGSVLTWLRRISVSDAWRRACVNRAGGAHRCQKGHPEWEAAADVYVKRKAYSMRGPIMWASLNPSELFYVWGCKSRMRIPSMWGMLDTVLFIIFRKVLKNKM